MNISNNTNNETFTLYRKLEEKDQEIEVLKAKVGLLRGWYHDIRTPLGPILAISKVLSKTELTNEQREQVVVLHNCSEQLLHVINAVIDFIDLETKDICLKKVSFDLRECLEQTIKNARKNLSLPNVQVSCLVDDLVPQTITHAKRYISEIIYLLIIETTHLKWTKEVFISVSLGKSDNLPGNSDMILRFTVSTSKMPRLFEDLEKMQHFLQQNKGDSQSSSLEMVLLKRLSDLLGGTIQMERDNERRVYFQFILPYTMS